MTIDKSPKNVRCDKALCKNMAVYSINTSGHKGNINLCEECFEEMFNLMKNMKKQITKIKEKK